jgi:DNA-binding LytR/AlgR family response regulator
VLDCFTSLKTGENFELTCKRDYFFVKTEYRIQRVDFRDILYIEGCKEYLKIHTQNEKIMTLLSFKSIEEILPSDNFIRVHKSFIVAINKINSIERNRIIINKQYIPIGETYRDSFLLMLNFNCPVKVPHHLNIVHLQ